jgi:hypothetical protein
LAFHGCAVAVSAFAALDEALNERSETDARTQEAT